MSNYVHNYLYCSESAKDKLLSPDFDYLYEISRGYGETIVQIKNDRFLVMFNTRGMEYRTDFINNFITEFKDTRWYCVEENEVEETEFYWNGNEIVNDTRNIIYELPGNEIRIVYYDDEFRPMIVMLLSDKEIVIENYLKNESKRFTFKKSYMSDINEFFIFLYEIENSKGFIEYYVPIKNKVIRESKVHWNDRTLYIEHNNYGPDEETKIENGESLLDYMLEFFEEILQSEGINEVISYNDGIVDMVRG